DGRGCRGSTLTEGVAMTLTQMTMTKEEALFQ
ncbi:MAG: hypothetical protein ACI9T7_002040, partial [Oleiphilaceae bacterium]